MKKLLLAFSLFATINAVAQSDVTTYSPGLNDEGVTYFLPSTLIEVVIDTEKEVFTPGEFAPYAERYLHMQGVPTTPSTTWSIKAMNVHTVGTRDPQKGFTVKLSDRSLASLIELSPEGTLLSINSPEEAELQTEETPTTKEGAANDPREYLNEEMILTTSTAKKAELVAKEIYNIRESRNNILRGQADNAPSDGEALKIILANLSKQEQAMLEMFRGTTKRETKQMVIRLIPGNEDVNRQVLFRFSKKLGVVSADDLGGAPIYYSLKNLTKLPPVDEKQAKKAKRPQGIVYNVPGKALLTIENNQESLYEEELPIAQYGHTDVLSTSLFKKEVKTRITFDPSTGAIRKIDK